MHIHEHPDGSVSYTGSFNAQRWDDFTSARDAKAKSRKTRGAQRAKRPAALPKSRKTKPSQPKEPPVETKSVEPEPAETETKDEG